MKRLQSLLVLVVLCMATSSYSQQTYTIDGQSYTLTKQVEGTLTLLWTTLEGEYRYFSQKGTDIRELKNTRVDGEYQQEFKSVLDAQTSDVSMNLEKVVLTLPSLESFFHAYNKRKDPNYVVPTKSIALKTRLGGFAGLTNNIYFVNPDNTLLPQIGLEFEIIDEIMLKRHSFVFQFTQVFSSSDYDFTSSQVSLSYRFKFIKCDKIDVFVNTRIATYTYIDRSLDVGSLANENDVATLPSSGGELQGPLAFGLGADIALGKGYLTLAYNDAVALVQDSNGEFPVNFTAGYKFNL